MITMNICQASCKPEVNSIELVNLILPAPSNLLIHGWPPIHDQLHNYMTMFQGI